MRKPPPSFALRTYTPEAHKRYMMRPFTLLGLGLLFFAFQLAPAIPLQAQEDTYAAVFRDSGRLYRASVFLTAVEIKHDNSATYYSYYQDEIHATQGGHAGRLLHGPYEVLGADNQLLIAGHFQQGLKSGLWKHWHGNGKLKAAENWKEGCRHGISGKYNVDGQLLERANYKQGQLHGKQYTYENGEVTSVKKYKNGEWTEEEAKEPKAERAEPAASPETPPAKPLSAEQKTSGIEAEAPALPEAPTTEERPGPDSPGAISIFVVDKESRQALEGASIKINQYNPETQQEKYRRFGHTSPEGHYPLSRDTGDVVLYLSREGYELKKVRIYGGSRESSILVELEKKQECAPLRITVEHGTKSFPLRQAEAVAYDMQGKAAGHAFTGEGGACGLCLPCGQRYRITARKEGFLPATEAVYIETDCSEQPPQQLKLLLAPTGSRPLAGANPPYPSMARPIPSAGRVEVLPTSAGQPTIQPRGYLVIAGTYPDEENARRRLKVVREKGYANAQAIKFIDAGIYCVCIGSFTNLEEAQRFEQQAGSKLSLRTYIREL
ncbi:MAG: SPOR domain-containing protein [Lewinellaceae bacterium]|nr:SPOR domain-containing protein [Lewinellaceae bacterium]